jgi:hypothetical protein
MERIMNTFELKIKLQSATVNTFLWYGNSDPYEVDEVFESAVSDDSLFSGYLCLRPNKPLNLDVLDTASSTWYLDGDFSELREEPLKDLLTSQNFVTEIIEVKWDQIEHEQEDCDWDGFEGDFYYNLSVEISVFLKVPNDSIIQEEIKEFVYQNLCFIEDISEAEFEHSSADGEILELEEGSKYLMVPIRSLDFGDGIIEQNSIEHSGDSEDPIALMRKSKVLAQFLEQYEESEDVQAFIKHNDMGFPLARFISAGIASPLPEAYTYINETYAMFLDAMEVSEKDVLGVDNLDDFLVIVEQRKKERDGL